MVPTCEELNCFLLVLDWCAAVTPKGQHYTLIDAEIRLLINKILLNERLKLWVGEAMGGYFHSLRPRTLT